ncbi:MAG: T9SS type A sorting domain-containing protein, partial [Candidatus Zixiibacteriota bacterium]
FTDDDGLTLAWRKPAKPMFHTRGLACLDEGNTMLATTGTLAGTMILKSLDAGCTWEWLQELPRVYGPLDLTPAPGGVVYAWSRETTVLYRIEGDQVKKLWPPFVILGFAVDPQDANHIRYGTEGCQIWESFDGGVLFTAVGNPANSGNTASAFFTVEFSPEDWDCALCGAKGAWRTINGGKTWKPISPFDMEEGDLVHRFAFSPTDPKRVWARGTLGLISNFSRQVFISDDGGANFTSVFKQYDIVPDQDGIPRLLRLKTWAPLSPKPDDPDIVYIPAGLYQNDYGTDFWRYDAGQDILSVIHINGLDDINSIAFNPVDPKFIYLGLGNAHATEEEPVDAAKAGQEAIRVAVSPNPFNPTANISFSLPSAAQVKLEVYNIKGQRVSTVVDQYLSAGDHVYSWDGSRFASGVYLYRLQAGEIQRTDKMLLLK